jgi:hypothetical protein
MEWECNETIEACALLIADKKIVIAMPSAPSCLDFFHASAKAMQTTEQRTTIARNGSGILGGEPKLLTLLAFRPRPVGFPQRSPMTTGLAVPRNHAAAFSPGKRANCRGGWRGLAPVALSERRWD